MNRIERMSVRGGPAVEALLGAACQAFQLRDIKIIKGRSRVHAIAQARCYISSVLRGEGFRFSTPEIGKILGGRNHSTVFYYLDVHEQNLQDESYSRRVREAEAIRARLSKKENATDKIAIKGEPE